MRCGFLCLTAIIDVYSRFIVGWQLSNSLEKETQTTLVRKAVRRHGKPEIIIRTKSKYNFERWVSTVKEHGIQISMDAKVRAMDNAYNECF
jgi:putative transposase